MINSIQAGSIAWKTYKFCYTRLKLPTSPWWMKETYELNAQDVLVVLKQQLAMTEFDGQCEYVSYEEFNYSGHHVLSNLILASWAIFGKQNWRCGMNRT
jgi:hypothetical protein